MTRTTLLAAALAAAVTTGASATFHFMQIEQVIGGVGGDTTAQAVQLRMRSPFQNLVSAAKLWVHDAAGENPVLLIDFTTNVPIGQTGSRVLVASESFIQQTNPETVADFTFTNLIPESYLAAGSMTFENNSGTQILWRLSWGGESYTGSNAGLLTNDDDGDFGPPYPDPLPTEDDRALLFQGAASDKSSTNLEDYALTDGAAVFTNNAADSFTVRAPEPCPWDCEEVPDGTVGINDFLDLLAQWQMVGTSCDIDGGGVGINDFLELLANWGECP